MKTWEALVERRLNRKEFLTVLGSTAVTFFLLKFFDTDTVLSTVVKRTQKPTGSYGNAAYGGVEN